MVDDMKNMERTLVLIKSDAIERGLTEEIIKRYISSGLRVVAKKTVDVDRDLAENHYLDTESQIVGMGNKTLQAAKEAGTLENIKKIFGTEDPKKIGLKLHEWMIELITSAPSIAMVLEGEEAVQKARRITGYTDPSKAEKGTIRGDFGNDSISRANEERRATKTLVHASGSKEEAEREIKLWFKPDELK